MCSLESSARSLGGNMWPNYQRDPETGITPDLVWLLALFFPGVTDAMAGTNLSGSLRTPERSIPNGVLSSVGAVYVLFMVIVWLFGSTVQGDLLRADKLLVAAVSWPHPLLVQVGIITSAVGAALQCIVGAANVLVAVAQDGVRALPVCCTAPRVLLLLHGACCLPAFPDPPGLLCRRCRF